MALEKKLSIEILRVLYEEGKLSLSELKEATGGNWETLLRRIEELKGEGLINSVKSKVFPFERKIYLTERGREVASRIAPKVETMLKDADELLLALLYGLGGELKGSTKLEKFVYRLERETDIRKCFKFRPYLYGPFSAEVLNAAQKLAFLGLIEIREEVWGVEGDYTKTLVIYSLTPKGRMVAKDCFNSLSEEVKRKIREEFREDSRKPTEIFLKEFYRKYKEFKKQTKLDRYIISESE